MLTRHVSLLALSALCLSAFQDQPNTGMADPEALASIYQNWLASPAGGRAARTASLGLMTLGGLTESGITAGGRLTLDLSTGELTVQVSGLPTGRDWDVWLIDNRAASSTFPDAGDRMIRAGRLDRKEGAHQLNARIAAADLAGFTLDRAVVADGRQTSPVAGFVLTGAPSLFERMRRGEAAGDAAAIARGRSVFRSEKFSGNGRTCNSCHAENNNFTLDARFISSLGESDALFVAESNPALSSGFENPSLMRRLGLIQANPDGFEPGRFALRAVPSLLALANSIVAPDPVLGADFTANGNNPEPVERLGWSNDAPPVRDFAIGAIVQHFAKSTGRHLASDFRLPTDEELDALAAYQLALGRYEDFDLKKLVLSSAAARRGQALFLDTGEIAELGHKNCNACHYNGGGTVAYAFNPGAPGFSPKLDGLPLGFNAANGTNTNDIPSAASLGLPRDGGFGTVPLPLGSFGNFGEVAPGVVIPLEEFATTTVVESADTAPFFHNHAAATLEDAVAFYGTPAYANSELSIGGPGGPVPVSISSNPEDGEVQAISAFLRVLNALENIRSAASLARRAQAAATGDDLRDLAALARGETADALRVLSEGAMARVQEDGITQARAALAIARAQFDSASRNPFRAAMDAAAGQLRTARGWLAKVETLPASFRK